MGPIDSTSRSAPPRAHTSPPHANLPNNRRCKRALSIRNGLPPLLRARSISEARLRSRSTTALRRTFSDLPPQDFDRGGSAPHRHGFRMEAALVQRGAPVIKPCKDIDLGPCREGSLIIKLL